MKSLIRKSLIALAIFWFVIPASTVTAAQYFVVIGAFSDKQHAVKFTDAARTYFEEVSWTYLQGKNKYYVHVMKTSRPEEASDWSLYVKQQTKFKDAWVLAEAETETPVYARSNANNDTNYLNDKSYVDKPEDVRTPERSAALVWTPSRELSYVSNVMNARELRGMRSAHVFKFVTVNQLGNPINVEVKLIDFSMLKKIAAFRSGEQVAIRGTKREQVVTFECDVLGYAPETKMFNLDHLGRSKDIRLNKDGVWEVFFRLKPMALHEVSFMHKTVFYENSAVLTPSSKTEMNELLSLLKSRQGYRIVIHSHCNPGGKRPLTLPADTKNYFDVANTVTQRGTDRKLTTARATVIRNFLVANGIDEDRLRVVGWGSADMLTPASAKDAYINDRLEIELVDQ